MNFKLVIFDLDGTLLDTLLDMADSMNYVLRNYGYPEHQVEKYKYFVGKGLRNLVKKALPEGSDDKTIDLIHYEMLQRYALRWADFTKPYEGIPEILNHLTAAGIKMAVLSNKPHEFTGVMIEKLLPDWEFQAVFGERKDVPRKPDPAGAFEICRLLDIKPEEVLYVGDSGTDMKTANAAGMYAVGVLWGFRGAEELLESGAKVLIKEPSEILTLVK